MLLFPLLLRNLRGEDVKEFTKNHTANKWQIWDLNIGILIRKRRSKEVTKSRHFYICLTKGR